MSETNAPHPDDIAVDRFAAAMKAKLAKKRAEGYGGWDNPKDCTIEHLSRLLIKHVGKGDPIDVGNLAMMIHQRGERIAASGGSQTMEVTEAMVNMADSILSRSRPGIPDDVIRLAIAGALAASGEGR